MIPAQPGDWDRQLLEIEILAVAVPVARQRRIEVHIGHPEAANEPLGGRAREGALVGEAQAGEVDIGVERTRLEFLPVVDDGLSGRAVAAQKIVEDTGANGVARGDVKSHTPLDGLGNVNAKVAEAQARARRASYRTARGGRFSDLEPANGDADTTIEGDLPPLRRAAALGHRIAGGSRWALPQGLRPPSPRNHPRHQQNHCERRHTLSRHAWPPARAREATGRGRARADVPPRPGAGPLQA